MRGRRNYGGDAFARRVMRYRAARIQVWRTLRFIPVAELLLLDVVCGEELLDLWFAGDRIDLVAPLDGLWSIPRAVVSD